MPVDEDGNRILSKRPTSIRARLRRSTGKTAQDLRALAEAQDHDYKPIEDWTLEELAAGKPRLRNGKLNTGPRPTWINGIVVEEIGRRLRAGFIDETRAALPDVLKVLKNLLENDDNPRIQLDAAKLFLAYAIGEPEKKVMIEASSRVEHMLADIVVLADGTPAHPIIDGQFEEEGDDDLPTKPTRRR